MFNVVIDVASKSETEIRSQYPFMKHGFYMRAYRRGRLINHNSWREDGYEHVKETWHFKAKYLLSNNCAESIGKNQRIEVEEYSKRYMIERHSHFYIATRDAIEKHTFTLSFRSQEAALLIRMQCGS